MHINEKTIEVIAKKSLVEFPEEVVVTEKQSGKTTVLELGCSLIWKGYWKAGRIAKAIRAVVKTASRKTRKSL